MKLQGCYIFANGELGRRAVVVGTPEAPKLGTIYDQAKDATDFTPVEIASIRERFGHRFRFEPVA